MKTERIHRLSDTITNNTVNCSDSTQIEYTSQKVEYGIKITTSENLSRKYYENDVVAWEDEDGAHVGLVTIIDCNTIGVIDVDTNEHVDININMIVVSRMEN